MNQLVVWGVDPGITGAVVSVRVDLDNREVLGVGFVSPALEKYTLLSGKKRSRINAHETYNLLVSLATIYGKPDIIEFEEVSAMPKQGVSSTFSFGRSTGNIEALASLFCSLSRVRPNVWKRTLGVPADKNAAIRWARAWAKEYFPNALEYLRKCSHDGRADALGLAVYGLCFTCGHDFGIVVDEGERTTEDIHCRDAHQLS